MNSKNECVVNIMCKINRFQKIVILPQLRNNVTFLFFLHFQPYYLVFNSHRSKSSFGSFGGLVLTSATYSHLYNMLGNIYCIMRKLQWRDFSNYPKWPILEPTPLFDDLRKLQINKKRPDPLIRQKIWP